LTMKRVILQGPDFCALTEDGYLCEYIPDRGQGEETEAILTGRVERIMAGLKSAFVDIGRSRSGFLPLEENSKSFTGGTLKSGDRVIVQIRKEETGQKGAFLSRDLTLAGSTVILMPMNRYIGVSRRITDEEIVKRLRATGEKLSGGRFGLVMRDGARYADERVLREETERLSALWESILRKAESSNCPAVLTEKVSAAERMLRDYRGRGEVLLEKTEELPPQLKQQLDCAGKRKIQTRHGATLVIDPCEAMTVIDVNTSSADFSRDRRANLLETNLEACREAVRQIRLRNISGIIIVDLIDMDEETDRSLVTEALQEAFQEDRTKTVIHGFTRLGLIEMTRKRTSPPLAEQMKER